MVARCFYFFDFREGRPDFFWQEPGHSTEVRSVKQLFQKTNQDIGTNVDGEAEREKHCPTSMCIDGHPNKIVLQGCHSVERLKTSTVRFLLEANFLSYVLLYESRS